MENASENRRTTLADVQEGRRATVVGFTGEKTLERRLQSLGIYGGAAVRVVKKTSGQAVVEVLNSKVALGPEALDAVRVVLK